MFLAKKASVTLEAPHGVRQLNGAPQSEHRAMRTWWHEVYHFIRVAKSIVSVG